MSDEWKPIDSAPKDALTFVLVYRPGFYPGTAYYQDDARAYKPGWYEVGVKRLDPQPTHWMPLPAPPSG